MLNRLTQTITYRNNVVFDEKHFKLHMRAEQSKQTHVDAQAWDILQNELLYNLNVGKSTSTFADRTRMSCLSNTAGAKPNQSFKFVGIALNSYAHGNRRAAQGLAAAREGTFTITNTGDERITAGKNVYVHIDTSDSYQPAKHMSGVPKHKKLLKTTSTCDASTNCVHIGKALSTAQRGDAMDILLC
tara:strand:+ start:901 stop:1461 length:561 start_codon:yes stop_codon:yes gene_type:complete